MRTAIVLALLAAGLVIGGPQLIGTAVAARIVIVALVTLLAGAGLAELSAATSRRAGPRGADGIERALRRRPPTASRPASLERIERRVTLGVTTAGDMHRSLRPLLLEIATDRLWHTHGLDLARTPERCQALLGDDLFGLITQSERPSDRRAPSPYALADVERFVTRLEAL